MHLLSAPHPSLSYLRTGLKCKANHEKVKEKEYRTGYLLRGVLVFDLDVTEKVCWTLGQNSRPTDVVDSHVDPFQKDEPSSSVVALLRPRTYWREGSNATAVEAGIMNKCRELWKVQTFAYSVRHFTALESRKPKFSSE